MDYITIRQTIQETGAEFFEQIYATNFDLANIAGEFMSLNEGYVILHQDIHETQKTHDILKTGFTSDQKRFLIRLRKRLGGTNVE